MRQRPPFVATAIVCLLASAWALLGNPQGGGLPGTLRVIVPLGALVLLTLTGLGALRARDLARRRLRELLELDDGQPLIQRIGPTGTEGDGRLASAIDRRLARAWEATEDLERERRLLSTILDEMKVGLLLIDRELKVQRANTHALELFGVGGNVRGVALSSLIRDPAVLAAAESVATTGSDHGVAAWKHLESGRQFDAQLSRLRKDEGAGALLLLYDITRLERLEAVRRDFVANVSHELRTPLTSIQAAVEALATGSLSDEQRAQFIRIIERQSGRMGALVEDLTDLSQIETGSIELELNEVDTRQVVAEVIEQLAPLAERLGVAVLNELPRPFPIVADRRRLEQMLTNLIHNGIKFNRPDGTVRILGTDSSRYRSLQVNDAGIGIPFDAQQRIFNRFFQVEQARSREIGGTGLGLAIVKHLMRLHGGRVRLESELGRGSTFSLDFPRGDARSSEAGEAAESTNVEFA